MKKYVVLAILVALAVFVSGCTSSNNTNTSSSTQATTPPSPLPPTHSSATESTFSLEENGFYSFETLDYTSIGADGRTYMILSQTENSATTTAYTYGDKTITVAGRIPASVPNIINVSDASRINDSVYKASIFLPLADQAYYGTVTVSGHNIIGTIMYNNETIYFTANNLGTTTVTTTSI